MIKLRPHHLLCAQSYSGHGYDKSFIENMDSVVGKLKNKNEKISLVFAIDDMCLKCPNRVEEKCITNEKVVEIDSKVIKYFNLEEKIYVYEEIIKKIKKEINKEILEDICGTCEWYTNKICTKKPKNSSKNESIPYL